MRMLMQKIKIKIDGHDNTMAFAEAECVGFLNLYIHGFNLLIS